MKQTLITRLLLIALIISVVYGVSAQRTPWLLISLFVWLMYGASKNAHDLSDEVRQLQEELLTTTERLLRAEGRLSALEKARLTEEKLSEEKLSKVDPVHEALSSPAQTEPPDTLEEPQEEEPQEEPQELIKESAPLIEEPYEEPREERGGWGAALWRDLMRGSLISKVGALILLVGVSMLIRYLAQRFEPSLGLIHIGALLASGGLTLFGVKSAQRNINARATALSVQGAGLAISCLVYVSASLRYELIEVGVALVATLATLFVGGSLALKQRSVGLMLTCLIGAYLAPFKLSPYSLDNAHLSLLSYDTTLNVTILWLAFKSSWRSLNLVGFIFTSLALSSWSMSWVITGAPPSLAPQLLLGMNMVIFIISPLMHSVRERSHLKGWLDGVLFWGAPALFFFVERNFLQGAPQLQGLATLLLACLYAALWAWVRSSDKRVGQESSPQRLLLALTVSSQALALAQLFEVSSVTMIWALEGLALAWLGLKQRGLYSLRLGVILSLLAHLGWYSSLSELESSVITWASLVALVTGLTLAGSALTLSWLSHQQKKAEDQWLLGDELALQDASQAYLGLLALGLVIGGVMNGLCLSLQLEAHLTVLIALTLGALLWVLLSQKRRLWPSLSSALLPLTLAASVSVAFTLTLSFEVWGLAPLLLPLIAVALSLRAHREDPSEEGWGEAPLFWARCVSFVSVMSFIAVALFQASSPLLTLTSSVGVSLIGLQAPLIALLMTHTEQQGLLARIIFPFWRRHESRWRLLWPLVFMQLLTQGLFAITSRQTLESVMFNVAHITSLATLSVFVVLYVTDKLPINNTYKRATQELTLIIGFLSVNMIIVKGAVMLGVTSLPDVMTHQGLQSTLAVLWGVSALSLMRFGSQRALLWLWWRGVLLLVLTLIKLWSVDLNLQGQLEYVLALFAVGGLMLFTGYWAPAPVVEDT